MRLGSRKILTELSLIVSFTLYSKTLIPEDLSGQFM